MAYFRKRGNTWYYTVDIGKDPVTGERRQKTKGGFKTKKEAQLAAAEIERAVADNVYVDEKNISFAEFAKDWLKAYEPTVKISTFDLRKRTVSILNNYFGALQIKTITRKQYQAMLDDLGKKYADNTMVVIHATGKLIFAKAVELEIIKTDPTKFTKINRKKLTIEEIEEGEIPKYMEKEELALFLETAKIHYSHQDYLAFLLLAYTGMRIGEMFALKWKDIDLRENTINITKTCYFQKNNSKEFILLTPKTKKSIRTIIVDDTVISELKTHKANQNEFKMRNRNVYKDHDFVLTSYSIPGHPYSKSSLEFKMKRILKLSGINKDLSPHSLRHTHTSLLAEAGVGLTEIMERLGHEDDTITKRIYLHVTKAKKLDAVKKFSNLMKNVSKM